MREKIVTICAGRKPYLQHARSATLISVLLVGAQAVQLDLEAVLVSVEAGKGATRGTTVGHGELSVAESLVSSDEAEKRFNVGARAVGWHIRCSCGGLCCCCCGGW